jgi:hypothetical protein
MAKTRKKLAARPPALPKMIGSEWANRKACERKRGFDLKVKAEVVALAIINHRNRRKRPAWPLRAYHCPVCGKWHLTHKEQIPRE